MESNPIITTPSAGPARRRAVFLDRDGTINRAFVRDGKPYPPRSLAGLEIFPEAPAALAELKRRGFLLVVVTNQPDVARGTQSRAAVEEIHAAIRAALPVDDIRVCWHDDRDGCACRKPRPGLLTEAARDHQIDLAHSYMIGDRWRDIDAGHNAGCAAVLIDQGYREAQPARPPEARVASLAAAVAWIGRRESAADALT